MLFPLRIFNSQEKIRLDDREQKATWKNVKSVHIERKSNFAFILIRRQLHQNDKFKLKKTRTNAHEMLIKHIDGTKNGVAFFLVRWFIDCTVFILCHTNGHMLFGICRMSPSSPLPCLAHTEYCHDHERGVFHHHIEMAHINKLKFTGIAAQTHTSSHIRHPGSTYSHN